MRSAPAKPFKLKHFKLHSYVIFTGPDFTLRYLKCKSCTCSKFIPVKTIEMILVYGVRTHIQSVALVLVQFLRLKLILALKKIRVQIEATSFIGVFIFYTHVLQPVISMPTRVLRLDILQMLPFQMILFVSFAVRLQLLHKSIISNIC